MSVNEGIESEVVEEFLKTRQRDYAYLTCDELERRPGSPRRTCFEEDSLGAFLGIVNDGSYILGIGSSDVIYLIEIGPDNKVVNVNLDNVYTFL